MSDRNYSISVSVGIPVFNESEYIEETVLSAVQQAEEVVICDNCSTDGTSEICMDLAEKFRNILYLKNSSNIGAYGNFKLCLAKASYKHFMFLGGHDIIEKDYIAALKSKLSEPGVIMAYGKPIHFNNANQVVNEYLYYFADDLMLENKYSRLYSLMVNLSNCTMIHGLLPRNIMSYAMNKVPPFIAFDHVVLSEIALLGKIRYVPEALYFRREAHVEDAAGANKRRLEILRVPEHDITAFPLQRMCEAQMQLMHPAGAVARAKARQALQMRYGYMVSSNSDA